MSAPTRKILLVLASLSASCCSEAAAWQSLDVPAVPGYEAEIPKPSDPLENESGAQIRITKDAGRVAELVGGEYGDKIEKQLGIAFDENKSDEERLTATTELKNLVNGLTSYDASTLSAKRQIRRRVRLVEAAVSALQSNPDDEGARKLANSLVLRTAVDFENSGMDAHAEIARMDYQRLKQYHPVVFNRIRPVIMDEYYNYNLHMVLSEPMLSRLVSDYQSQSGNVAECVLGAWVTGCQVTDTNVRADIKPSSGQAMFQLLVDGRTTTNTQGRKSPATVFTRGNHHFNIVKNTYFNGKTLTSSPANMNVNADNQTVGFRTDYDRIPIIRGIVRKIAEKEIAKKEVQSESIAARKLADEALPRFESEVQQKFSEANSNLQDNVLQNLRNKNIEPQSFSARSSETHLAISSRTMATGNLGGTPPPTTPAPARGIAVQIHESAINAAVDSLGISGRMTVDEVIGRIESSLADFLGRGISLRPADKVGTDKTEFDFTAQDAIRIRFDERRVVIILRTGFFQPENDRTIPKHVFEIPLEIYLEGGNLTLIPPATDAKGILSLRPQAIEGRSSLRSVAQARGIAKNLIDKTFEEPVVNIKRDVDIKMGDGSMMTLTITQFELTDGWLTTVFE